MALFIQIMAIAFTIGIISDFLTGSSTVNVNPIFTGGTVVGGIIISIILTMSFYLLAYWLFGIVIRTKNLIINRNFIEFKNHRIKWSDVRKVSLHAGWLTLLRIEVKAKKKNILGILPLIDSGENVAAVAEIAKGNGVTVKRWLV